jgi:hypothetical protein
VLLPTLNVYYLLHMANIALTPNSNLNDYSKFFQDLHLKGDKNQCHNLLVVGPRANAKTLTVTKGLEILSET